MNIGRLRRGLNRVSRAAVHGRENDFNRRQRARLWQSVLEQNRAGGLLAPVRIEKLARKFKVGAGTIDMAVKTALTASGAAAKGFEKAVELALEAHRDLKTEDGSSREEAGEKGYCLDGLNVEGNIADLMGWMGRFDQKLRSVPEERVNVNLLLYGPPGTGKSALARHIADRLDREIVCKRMSDLQSMWVGEGEKIIRRAFEEAENEEAVLVIDEADSVLFSRDRARHSWEISFTKEFLTRMEHFRGILICTTNRMDDLDQACLRRFNRKIRFDYLTCRGVLIFYERMLAHLVASPLGAGEEADFKRLTNLAPGDFKNVRDRFALQFDRVLVECSCCRLRLLLGRSCGVENFPFHGKVNEQRLPLFPFFRSHCYRLQRHRHLIDDIDENIYSLPKPFHDKVLGYAGIRFT
jgi:hypothetical protein